MLSQYPKASKGKDNEVDAQCKILPESNSSDEFSSSGFVVEGDNGSSYYEHFEIEFPDGNSATVDYVSASDLVSVSYGESTLTKKDEIFIIDGEVLDDASVEALASWDPNIITALDFLNDGYQDSDQLSVLSAYFYWSNPGYVAGCSVWSQLWGAAKIVTACGIAKTISIVACCSAPETVLPCLGIAVATVACGDAISWLVDCLKH